MPRDFQPVTYILASQRNGTIYTGVTSNLMARIHQHREGPSRGFTRRHGIKLLVWFEVHATMESAILREKRIKKWEGRWKLELIEEANPEWRDLAEDLGFPPLAWAFLGFGHSRFSAHSLKAVFEADNFARSSKWSRLQVSSFSDVL